MNDVRMRVTRYFDENRRKGGLIRRQRWAAKEKAPGLEQRTAVAGHFQRNTWLPVTCLVCSALGEGINDTRCLNQILLLYFFYRTVCIINRIINRCVGVDHHRYLHKPLFIEELEGDLRQTIPWHSVPKLLKSINSSISSIWNIVHLEYHWHLCKWLTISRSSSSIRD